MLQFAVKYQIIIDNMIADKTLKLHKFELDHDNWKIMYNLASVLKVHVIYLCTHI